MKNRLFTALFLGVIIAACNKENSAVTPSIQRTHSAHAAYRLPATMQDTATSRFIPLDSANEMISSYLYSISYGNNDTDVRSFSVNADSLRAYLSDPSIKNVKLVFAHTLNYINAGNKGVYAGYQTGAMTIIIAAYNGEGNYVYHGGQVLDHLAPCPYACPTGVASNDLLN
jgi:hypothetical protein